MGDVAGLNIPEAGWRGACSGIAGFLLKTGKFCAGILDAVVAGTDNVQKSLSISIGNHVWNCRSYLLERERCVPVSHIIAPTNPF